REQEERARTTLMKHRRGLDLVAEALLEHETIDGAEVARLIQTGLGTPNIREQAPKPASDPVTPRRATHRASESSPHAGVANCGSRQRAIAAQRSVAEMGPRWP
ncbi:MAG: hypothetical protein EBW96_07085, partial [Actinobacteria bacterium]|nr:hypothetical protein [Actinomycetota bacterium]